MVLCEMVSQIRPADGKFGEEAKKKWDSLAKPIRGLGLLEDAVTQIASITGSLDVKIARRALVVMCADNGVVEEGVTQTGKEVTAAVTENFARGETTVCRMARLVNCRVVPVDIGVARKVAGRGILRHKIAYGTRNFHKEPAMTREQAEKAISIGFEIASELVGEGYNLFATGEMGIGNTSTSSAICAVLLGKPPAEVTGRGAGLDRERLQKKIRVIEEAIALHRPNADDILDVLSKVGGFDIAGLCGVYLAGAACRVPVLADGVISLTAALCAVRLCPAVKDFIIATHQSKEPASRYLTEALDLHPFVCADMALGEGTGAVAALPLLDMAVAVFDDMPTFQEIDLHPYRHFCDV